MTENIKDIKFSPKFFNLVLGAACYSGDLKFYTPIQPNDLKDWQESFSTI
jgi:hypothetical protein